METTLGSAQIAIRAVTDKLDSDLSGARKMVTGVLEDIKKPVMVGMATVVGAITAVGVGLLAYTGHATMAAARTSEMRAVLNLLGERAGWTADEIEGNVQAMRDLGIRTDVAQDMLAQFARNQLDAADATMAARVAQDLAVLSGRDSSEVLAELNYAVQTQNSSLQVFRDLGIQAGDALKTYAESVGKSVEELDKAERMQAMLNAVQEAGLDIAGVYATAMEEPGKAMRSLGRHFYETSLAVGQHFLPVLGKGVEFVTNFIKEIRGLLEEGAPLGDLFAALGGLAEFAAEKLFGLATDGMGGLAEKIGPAIEKVTEIVTMITDLWFLVDKGWMDPLDALKFGLTEVFGEDTANKVMDIVTKVQEFIDKVQEILEPITNWVKENVELKDILMGVGIVIAAVLVPAVWALMLPFIKLILIAAAIVLIIAALRTAWENDFLGIRTALTDFWDNTAKPILEKVWEWLKVNVPIALEALRSFWVEKAWPAIQGAIETVWPIIKNIFESISTFITDTLIPTIKELYTKWVDEIWPTIQTVTENVWTILEEIFSEVGRWINDNIVPWIEFLKEKWADEIWPAIQTALETVWAVIEPIWESLREWMAETLPPVMESLQTTFEKIMDGIKGAIQPVKDLWDLFVGAIEKFWDWISNKVFSFKINLPNLPDWAIPGSPLPIHTAWKAFTDDMERLSSGLNTGLGMVPASAYSPAPLNQDYSKSWNVTINSHQTTGSIYQDLALVEAML